MQDTKIPLRQSLSYRQARNTVIVAFMIGLTLSTAQISFDYFSLQNEVRSSVNNILTTANRAAFHAAYNLDEIGAEQITRGLVSNRPIIKASITDNFGNLLGRAEAPGRENTSLITRWLFGETRIIEKLLYEDQRNSGAIGKLQVAVDPAITAETFIQRSVLVMLSGIVRNFILAVVLIAVFYYTITRSILFASTRLQSGETNERIPMPESHSKDEIGVLINAFNSHLEIIDDQHQQIIETNNNLERLVDKRTQQLDEKNRELDKEKTAALAASQAKSDFLAMMSHEIRTPMNGVLGMAELLGKNITDTQQKEYVDAIVESGKSLLTLMNNVLDYSKYENQNLTFESIPFNLRRLVNSIIFLMSAAAEKKHILLSADIDSSIPEILVGDPERLRQVILNLISNAIKFTDQGKVVLSVTSGAGDQESLDLQFSVQDTGIGIAAGQKAQVFDPFTQASDAISRRYGGTGMGLAICKQIIEQQGGEIGFSSEEGKGSNFWFKLKLWVSDQPEAIASPPLENMKIPILKVLVVDDVTINQKLAKGQLQSEQHRVFVASDGSEALEVLQQQPIDLILMDLHMPVMDGLEATRRIREHTNASISNIPIIGITANISDAKQQECLAAGMNAVTSKPIESEKLNHILAKVIRPNSGPSDLKEAALGVNLTDRSLIEQHKRNLGLDETLALYKEAEAAAKKRMGEINGAFSTGNIDEIKSNAHALAGLCANFGFVRLRELAIKLENKTAKRDLEAVGKLIAELGEISENSFSACREALVQNQ